MSFNSNIITSTNDKQNNVNTLNLLTNYMRFRKKSLDEFKQEKKEDEYRAQLLTEGKESDEKEKNNLRQVVYNSKDDYESDNIFINYEDNILFDRLSNIDNNSNIDYNYTDHGSLSNRLQFELPRWGIEEYISDRNRWVKGIKSVSDEQGWFYFKVFFKFNTNFGLFGGLLGDSPTSLSFPSNCALRYLKSISLLYKQEQIVNRIIALKNFITILSRINTQYPWMISSITGLEKAMNVYTNNFSEDKSIELGFNIESTDMKLLNMLNYYRYACYDDINCKEIIPENLRKFDMMVVLYHVPIKYFQTAIMTSPKKDISLGVFASDSKLAKVESIINKTFNFLTTKTSYYKYKRMEPDNNDMSNMMSFNMFTFHGCEFDMESFEKYFEGLEMKNESPFQITETALKIKYDRVYFHTMNEWTQTLFGSDGFWYDKNSGIYPNEMSQQDNFADRLDAIKKARESSTFFDKNAEQYKSLIDYAESLITDGLMSMDMKNYYAFLNGNIYGDVGVDSKYFKTKMKYLSGKGSMFTGNLYGVITGPTGKDDGGYFVRKLRALKDGTYFNSQIELKSENNIYDPFTINQRAKQDTSILNYLKNVTGRSKIKSNNGLLGGAMDAANDIASFWKW